MSEARALHTAVASAQEYYQAATDTHAMSRAREAIGRKADTQWVATGVSSTMLASLGLIGSSSYFTCNQTGEARLEAKITTFSEHILEDGVLSGHHLCKCLPHLLTLILESFTLLS